MKLKYTTETQIEKAKSIHGPDKQGYDRSIYLGATELVEIYCYECQEYFWQKAIHHTNKMRKDRTRLSGCKNCATVAQSDKIRLTKNQYVDRSISLYGNKFDYSESIYTGWDNPITIYCNECNKYFTAKRAGCHLKSGRCHKCNVATSKPEIQIGDYLKQKDIIFLNNCKDQIINPHTNNVLELDIYFPTLKKAIEFNGTYWHSDSHPDTQRRDKIKQEQCNEKGIDLLVIPEQDWISNKNNVFRTIDNFIGIQ